MVLVSRHFYGVTFAVAVVTFAVSGVTCSLGGVPFGFAFVPCGLSAVPFEGRRVPFEKVQPWNQRGRTPESFVNGLKQAIYAN